MAIETPPAIPLASSSWLGAEEYEVGDELHERAMHFLAAVNWDVLAVRASKAHGDVPCRFEEKFSIGHFNMVRHSLFGDGTNWIARLRMPELPNVFGIVMLLTLCGF